MYKFIKFIRLQTQVIFAKKKLKEKILFNLIIKNY